MPSMPRLKKLSSKEAFWKSLWYAGLPWTVIAVFMFVFFSFLVPDGMQEARILVGLTLEFLVTLAIFSRYSSHRAVGRPLLVCRICGSFWREDRDLNQPVIVRGSRVACGDCSRAWRRR